MTFSATNYFVRGGVSRSSQHFFL